MRRCEELTREANRFRLGAEGERRTARALRPLIDTGWEAFHDLDWTAGNIDHVIAGPPGVFLLETKNWNCRASVAGGRVVFNRRVGDNGPREVGGATLRRAKALQRKLSAVGFELKFVAPMIVWWGQFPERIHKERYLTWIHGDELARWLGERPSELSHAEIAEVASLLRPLAAQPDTPAR